MIFLKNKDLVYAIGRYSHMGFLLMVLSVGGFFLGWWLDKKLWDFPALGILFFLIGFAGGFYRFILMLEEDRRSKK